jgi:hypothetical protein
MSAIDKTVGLYTWTMTDLGAAVCASFSQGTSAFGTNRTSQGGLTISVYRGRPEVVGVRQNDAIDPYATSTEGQAKARLALPEGGFAVRVSF